MIWSSAIFAPVIASAAILAVVTFKSAISTVFIAPSFISDDNIVSRELALMKVKSTPETRSEIVQLVSIYRAKIIDVSSKSIIIEATGDDQKIKALQDLLSNFGISEVMRTGIIAMNREKN